GRKAPAHRDSSAPAERIRAPLEPTHSSIAGGATKPATTKCPIPDMSPIRRCAESRSSALTSHQPHDAPHQQAQVLGYKLGVQCDAQLLDREYWLPTAVGMVQTYDLLPCRPPNHTLPVGLLPRHFTSQCVGRVAQTTSAIL